MTLSGRERGYRTTETAGGERGEYISTRALPFLITTRANWITQAGRQAGRRGEARKAWSESE